TSTYATLPDGLRQALALGDYALGSTVGVAVLDSGLADNGDFTGRIAAFYDFTASNTGKPVASSPYDDYGHGTHVAGLVGSSGALSTGAYAGIAQTVRFFVLKVLDKSGRGRTSDLINAIEFVIANKDALNIHVINLSLGHPIYESAATDPLVLEVERASAAGLIVVAAAGNIGTNPVTGLPGY